MQNGMIVFEAHQLRSVDGKERVAMAGLRIGKAAGSLLNIGPETVRQVLDQMAVLEASPKEKASEHRDQQRRGDDDP